MTDNNQDGNVLYAKYTIKMDTYRKIDFSVKTMLVVSCFLWAGSNTCCSAYDIYIHLTDYQYYIAYVFFEFFTYYLLSVGFVLLVLLAAALYKLMSLSKGLQG